MTMEIHDHGFHYFRIYGFYLCLIYLFCFIYFNVYICITKDYDQETKTLTQTIVAEQEEERALSTKMWFLLPCPFDHRPRLI